MFILNQCKRFDHVRLELWWIDRSVFFDLISTLGLGRSGRKRYVNLLTAVL